MIWTQDENGKGRLKARIATLFPGTSVQFVGVENDFEAAINLVRADVFSLLRETVD